MSCQDARYLGQGHLMHCEVRNEHKTHGAKVIGRIRIWHTGEQCHARQNGLRCYQTLGHTGEHIGLRLGLSEEIRWGNPYEQAERPCGDRRDLDQDTGWGLRCIRTGEHDLHFAQPCGVEYYWAVGVGQCARTDPAGRRCFWDATHVGSAHASIDASGQLVPFDTAETCPHVRVLGARHVVSCESPFDHHTVHTAHVQGRLFGWRTDEEQCLSIGPSQVRCYRAHGHHAEHFSVLGSGGPLQRWTTSKRDDYPGPRWPQACGEFKIIDGPHPARDRTLRCCRDAGHPGAHEGYTNTSGELKRWGVERTPEDVARDALKVYITDKIAEIAVAQPQPRSYAERKKRRHH